MKIAWHSFQYPRRTTKDLINDAINLLMSFMAYTIPILLAMIGIGKEMGADYSFLENLDNIENDPDW